jgi:hypothetical protein
MKARIDPSALEAGGLTRAKDKLTLSRLYGSVALCFTVCFAAMVQCVS